MIGPACRRHPQAARNRNAYSAAYFSTAQEVAEAVHPPGVTRADLEAVMGVLVDAIRESASAERIARQVEDQAPMFAKLGPFLRTPGGVIAILGLLITLAGFVRDVVADAAQDPASVTVQVDGPSAEDVERIVQERLRRPVKPRARVSVPNPRTSAPKHGPAARSHPEVIGPSARARETTVATDRARPPDQHEPQSQGAAVIDYPH